MYFGESTGICENFDWQSRGHEFDPRWLHQLNCLRDGHLQTMRWPSLFQARPSGPPQVPLFHEDCQPSLIWIKRGHRFLEDSLWEGLEEGLEIQLSWEGKRSKRYTCTEGEWKSPRLQIGLVFPLLPSEPGKMNSLKMGWVGRDFPKQNRLGGIHH